MGDFSLILTPFGGLVEAEPTYKPNTTIRHVKCGEEKPECNKCTSTGRKCDGYTEASQKQLHQVIVTSASQYAWGLSHDRNLVLVPGTREEREYVQFFSTQTAHALSGFFPSDFWTKFLPQLSHLNPAIRHAVAAVGALHQRQLRGTFLSANADSGENKVFALQQYNKAIQKFLEQMGKPNDMEIDKMLIQCVLFICLEMLNGNIKQAMDHVEGGLKILTRQLQHNKPAAQGGPGRELSQFFYRQRIQLSYFGRQLVLSTDMVSNEDMFSALDGTLVFHNIDQARDCLTNVMTRGMFFIRSVQSQVWASPQEPLSEQQIQQQANHLEEVKGWRKSFERLRKRSAKTIGVSDPRAPLSMICQCYAAEIWLSTCTSLDEMNFDNFNVYFENIVSAGEQLVELCPKAESNAATEHFFLDAEVMPVLYWTTLRCRHPIWRRRALSALSSYPAREGLWDKGLHLAVARRLIELEEIALVHLPVEQRVPSERQRIYDAMISPDMESIIKPCPVCFHYKSQGPMGPWDAHWENVCW
ncbi:hypothetical protein N7462_002258 [Penicillium macrosclerotiorum]|uniref:uncharacterized protein n=1 Tax=Penicillium macrosclerotiorum TaxID=303699 RepID=UPI0025470264|nr:uncharacterized protein N7462_002258 [Penicillium macrosclerotiorum]KAJ5692835.1 hypothetical protein N7462_002258 [Penicillium macrosclerotiorum]